MDETWPGHYVSLRYHFHFLVPSQKLWGITCEDYYFVRNAEHLKMVAMAWQGQGQPLFEPEAMIHEKARWVMGCLLALSICTKTDMLKLPH